MQSETRQWNESNLDKFFNEIAEDLVEELDSIHPLHNYNYYFPGGGNAFVQLKVAFNILLQYSTEALFLCFETCASSATILQLSHIAQVFEKLPNLLEGE